MKPKRCAHPKRWTEEETEFLREHYPTKGAVWVAEQLGRTADAIWDKSGKMGVLTDPETNSKRRGEAMRRQNAAGLMRKSSKRSESVTGTRIRSAPLVGEAKITSETRVTIAPPFVDRRFLAEGEVSRVVDSSQCRPWAKAAA